jgi:hypothetical protein
LTKESEDLAQRIKNVDNTMTSQNRVIQLNDSYSKRMSAYTHIVMVFVFALAIAIIMKLLKNNTQLVPEAVLFIVYALLASVSIIYSMFILSDIISREKNDFDKLVLPAPKAATKKDTVSSATDDLEVIPSLLAAAALGSTYCGDGTIYNTTDEKCEPGCNSGKYLNVSSGTCSPCDLGYSKFGDGPELCTLCDAGKIAATTGLSSCTPCATGTSANAGRTACVATTSG